MTTAALNSALSGLRVAQKALDVTSSNISNASIEGYTKKNLTTESVSSNGIGIGVRFGEVQRTVNEYIQRDYRTQLGIQSFLDTRSSYLSRITALHGSTDAESNISAQLGKLYDGFVNLSGTPDSTAVQSSIVSQATNTAKTINKLAQQMLSMRNQAEQQIKSEVNDLNASLQQIATLNKKIHVAYNVQGQSPAALEDQRDQLIKKVSGQIDVSYFVNGENILVLQTKAGQVLADDVARTISFDDQAVTFGSSYPASLGGLLLQGDQVGSTYDLAAGAPGGKLGALFSLRDQDLPNDLAQLDEMAHKLMTRFDDQGVRLFTNKDGIVPPNDPQQYVGLANEIQVNARIVADTSLLQKGTTGSPINAGSNTNIMNVVNYTFGRFKDASGTLNTAFNTVNLGAGGDIAINTVNDPNASLLQFSNAMLDNQAADANSSKSALDNETQYTNEVQKRLLESSAVNTDEELGRMIEYQKSYSANAKMIGALDQLFKELLNII